MLKVKILDPGYSPVNTLDEIKNKSIYSSNLHKNLKF